MKQIKFSLIMATVGRYEEVDEFLKSIEFSTYDNSKIQIIIVDQNENNILDNMINKYNNLNIEHIKSNTKGLAKNRNIGIKKACGEIIAFPDDDCELLKDTLKSVEEAFNQYQCDIVMGRIVERDGEDSLRSWPKERINITRDNFYTKCSSITMFLKRESCIVNFNEKLGVGSYYGSCEDSDIIYKNLSSKKVVKYIPEVKLYHPHYNPENNMGSDKVYSYALGFGAFVKDNIDIHTLFLFTAIIAYHSLKCLKYLIIFNKDQFRKSFLAIKGRVKGLISYK